MGCDQTGEGSSNERHFGEEKSMLRITNVPKKIDTENLKKVFEQHGQVSDFKLDEESGTCFLSYACQEDAKKAIDACHNKLILPGGERPIIVVFQKSLVSLGKKFKNLRKLEGRKKKSTGNENVDDKNIDQEITDLKNDIFETIAIGSSQSLFDLAALVAQDRSNGLHNLPQNDIDLEILTLESARDRIMNKLQRVEYKVGTDGAGGQASRNVSSGAPNKKRKVADASTVHATSKTKNKADASSVPAKTKKKVAARSSHATRPSGNAPKQQGKGEKVGTDVTAGLPI